MITPKSAKGANKYPKLNPPDDADIVDADPVFFGFGANAFNGVSSCPSKIPITNSKTFCFAESVCPAFTNPSVASFPACSSRISAPPGCSN